MMALSEEKIIMHMCAPYTATLPDGSVVDLPVGTTLQRKEDSEHWRGTIPQTKPTPRADSKPCSNDAPCFDCTACIAGIPERMLGKS